MLSRFGIEAGEQTLSVLRGIDKLPKIGEAKVGPVGVREWIERRGNRRHLRIPQLSPDQLATWFEGSETGELGAKELTTVLTLAKELGISEYVEVDLSIARGLDYYTGTIYETFLKADESLDL